MKLTKAIKLIIQDVKVIQYGYFPDSRGFFTEPYRKSDLAKCLEAGAIAGKEILQINESFSKKGVIRGLHFQWKPYMGKLVRTIRGHMVDMFLDIRKNSPTFGKLAMYDMPCRDAENYSEWIWVPPGFAHGNFFLEPTRIEYLCTGEYSQACEGAISPLANDIDWSLCDVHCKQMLDKLFADDLLIISEKDRSGLTLSEWKKNPDSKNFIFGEC